MKMLRHQSALVIAAVLAGLGFTMAGCDWLAEQAGIDEVEVSTSSFAGNIPVLPESSAATTGTVNRPGVDLPRVFDVDRIIIEEEDVSYSPIMGKEADPASTCNLNFLIILDRYPAVRGNIQIEDNQDVTEVTINAVGDTTGIAAIIGSVSEDDRPDIINYEGLSVSQIRKAVGDALRGSNFSAAIIVRNTGMCAGTLSIDKMTFNLNF